MPTRRDFVRTTTAAGGALALGLGPSACASLARPLDVLILGGTSFLGPHLIKYALDRGHTISTFTRGQTEPSIYQELFANVEPLIGDRENDLTALEGRTWDAVIDNSGRRVAWTRDSAELLKDSAQTYIYTSSTGVYLPYLGMDITEDTEVILEDPPEVPEDRRPSYGVMKSLSEIAVHEAFGDDRTVVMRPTYIIGPADPSNRFPYWPVRMDRGGEVLVPGKADDPVQFIDVRDLTEWMIRLAERQASGTFNVAGPASALGMQDFADRVHAAVDSTATLVHVDDYDFLLKHDVRFVVPWLMPTDDYVGSARINNQRAIAAGLTFRPLDQSTRDVLAWWKTDAVEEERRERLTSDPRSLMARETEVLAAWRSRMGQA